MSHGVLAGLFSRGRSEAPAVPIDSSFMDTDDSMPGKHGLEADRSFECALDSLPCNAMFCDRDLILRYLNRSSRKPLLSLQQHLPVPVQEPHATAIRVARVHAAQARRRVAATSAGRES